jgi:nucleotide-binding universal stress UspA family protein
MSTAEFCPMSKLDKLLLATDRSAFSEGAVQEAINFANKCSSRLYVMSVLESNPEYETIGLNAYKAEEDEAIQYLQSVKSRASQAGLNYCEVALHYGEEPYQLIVNEAADREVDMIIIGRRGRTGILKVLMGQVAAKVIGHAPCKVLVVPKAAKIEFRNILVATDGSMHSVAAASEAIGIAKRHGSSILAVSILNSEEEKEAAKKNVNNVVEAARRENVPAEALTPLGKPHDSIVEIAGGRGVDLIVMGAYGKTGFKKFLMGSTTEKVIGHASCAILVVRGK